MLNVGSSKTRVALLRFSNTAEIEFYFNQYSTVAEYESAIQQMASHYVGGNTNTTGGLYIGRTQLFSPSNGARTDVPLKIAIVVTDGQATVEAENLSLQANSLKAVASVMAIGVTSAVDDTTLKIIATDNNVYRVENFAALQGSALIRQLTVGVCDNSVIKK